MKSWKHRVAEALVTVNPHAGCRWGRLDSPETKAERVANLLRKGPYGVYVATGDPHGWGGGGAVATIYMEQKGGEGDCIMPLDYYDSGMEFSIDASDLLKDAYIEFVNAAVACVYRV